VTHLCSQRAVLPALALLVLFLAAGSVFAAPAPESKKAPDHKYRHYVNVRYRYALDYPADLLTGQGESENSDGQKFVSGDKKANLAAWGEHAMNAGTGDPMSLAQAYAEDTGRDKTAITYKAMSGNWYVCSGITGGTIFYRKTVLEGGDFKRFELTYPQDRRKIYDPVAAHISRSFHSTISAEE
jgi:hypothetical protein